MPLYFDVRVSLVGIKPEIWRRFLLAETLTFADLHEAIQESFGWDDYHLSEFRDGRRVVARSDYDDDFSEGNVPTADKVTLASSFNKRGKKLRYVYDFGDNWEHDVEFIGSVESPEEFERRLLDGARACPPEDCGGIFGYEECVKISGVSEDDLEKLGDEAEGMLEHKEWLGDWDPESFDLDATKKDFDE